MLWEGNVIWKIVFYHVSRGKLTQSHAVCTKGNDSFRTETDKL